MLTEGALVAVPAGILIGFFLGVLGGGGAMLAVPMLVYGLGEPVKEATTSSLAFVCAAALSGAIVHARAGRVIVPLALVVGPAGVAGALIGTALNRLADPAYILGGLGLLMLVVTYLMLLIRPTTATALPDWHLEGIDWARAVTSGLGVGVLTGFFGVGGGFIIVPMLIVIFRLEIGAAVATSLAVVSFISAAALVAHLSTGEIDWSVSFLFVPAGIAGVLGAATVGHHIPEAAMTRVFGIVSGCLAVFLIAKNVSVLR